MDEVVAIVVAAGQGTRMGPGQAVKKQFRLVAGKPLLDWTLEAIARCAEIDGIVVVTGVADVARLKRALLGRPELKVRDVVPGGASRRESVASGLAAVGPDARWIVVHDGVRPLVSPALVSRVLAAARVHGAATAGLPVSDTVKRVEPGGRIVETVDRTTLWSVQTPQAFARALLEEAHRQGGELDATDDAGLVERLGRAVYVVRGSAKNVKVTTEEDLEIVASWLAEASAAPGEVVCGFGFDVHRIKAGRALVLGGVRIDCPFGLDGHSDADVLTHAIIDALFGAAALGDIGTHFPDTDPAYRGADSLELLRTARQRLVEAGCRILHVDAFVSAEAPRLKGHIPLMRTRLAEAMAIPVTRVSIKAGTGEGVGPVGRGEVIEARAVATVRRPPEEGEA